MSLRQTFIPVDLETPTLAATMSVTLHTTAGTIKIEVFCESVPKTAEVILTKAHPTSFARVTLWGDPTSS